MIISSKNKKGSALILTMFIMAGMIIVAMSGAYVVFLGIKAGGLQAQSGRAYYAAETGAEYFLWRLRKNGYIYPNPSASPIFIGTLTGTGNYSASYSVYFVSSPNPLVFSSIGSYQNSKRSVEIRIGE